MSKTLLVQDYCDVIKNRFELVVLASYRTRALLSGSKAADGLRGKPVQVALKEIAAKKVDFDALKEEMVKSLSPKTEDGEFLTVFKKSSILTDESESTESIEIDLGIFGGQNIKSED